MATRSRTFLFVQYRNSFGHLQRRRRAQAADTGPNAEEEGLIERTNEEGELVIELAHLPPRWVDLVDDFDQQLEDIAGKTRRLEELHKKHLLPGFDDRSGEEREIRLLTQDITTQFQSCGELVRGVAQQQTFGQEQTVGRNIQASLAQRLQEKSQAFRKAQSAYMHRLSLRKDINSDVFAVDADHERAVSRKFDMTLSDEQLMAVEANEAAVSQREGEISAIHESIVELAAIFGQMQEMIIDQGTLLDRIDYNVETAVVKIAAGADELEEADRHQKGAVANKCIIALGVVVIILVVILLLKWL
ncbi:t-SNARE affecting a late Golgi compartment protein 2 [Coemansia sp. RSA 1290]|nr:t-SNARE [Coemansia mojavensis]KAJ1743699.1 Integral membrane protein SED5 [Coemansia sp. RSA 1086]KAJ1752871.1 Integral membrane protein SED5 [Coemansia sp. RSA 1821]KAJ2631033.1 t-SNARE affecting a late Golgi compartment protein 2 [Coemansia sp. RSA 1290]KAJ2650979.1 Integral membrane protein SED5 [Coemansia sp. RSA 1250]KAJ2673533.1 Integral membrane protein SED5 [Coemansia sp. RSA 1085]